MELRTDELTLHFEDDGDADKPPVLVLHGITQSTATWEWLLPHLVDEHRVVRLDFRGHGRSGRTPGEYHFPGYVADATAICEQVLAQPAVVIGHSLGGGTAAALAQARPDLVRGIVLEDPALATGAAEDVDLDGHSLFQGFRLLRDSLPGVQAAGMAVVDLVGILRSVPSPSGLPFGELIHEDALDAMAEGMLQLDATVLDPVFDGTMKPVFDAQEEIPVPGIVLAADPAMPDAVTTPADLALLEKHSPRIESRVVAGCGHLIHDSRQHRPAIVDAVRDLLTRL